LREKLCVVITNILQITLFLFSLFYMEVTKMSSLMYADLISWNPFKGCNYNCVYCEPSFKRQAKRQKHRCERCARYEPHFHPERLRQYLPKNREIACCINGDVAFATLEQMELIFKAIRQHPTNTFIIQSKNPSNFFRFDNFPDNSVLGTTIETNRGFPSGNVDEPYSIYSNAPFPIERYLAMRAISHRKSVTVEPIMDFDLDALSLWIEEIAPEVVWVGYANKYHTLPEPPLWKTLELIERLKKFTEVRLKTIREPLTTPVARSRQP